MFSLLNSTSSQLAIKCFNSLWSIPLRNASKKASGACRNKKQAPGKRWSIKILDGAHAFGDDIIATQNRLRYHPGLNVKVTGKFHLKALKEGTVRFTCERADLNYQHRYVKRFYEATENTPIYKKYAHVIPKPQHTRFRTIRQI